MFKKHASKGLSILLSATTLFAASAPYTFAKEKIRSEQETKVTASLKEKSTSFYKKHPTLCRGLLFASSIAASAIIHYTIREWNLRDVTTAIDNLSKDELENQIRAEISKYTNRAPDVFKIDPQLVKKSDHRFLLLSLMRINYLFDKYSGFTEDLINYRRGRIGNKKFFYLWPLDFKNYKSEAWGTVGITENDLSGIGLTTMNHRNLLYGVKKGRQCEHFSPGELDQLAEHILTHEFGHAVEMLYAVRKSADDAIADNDDSKEIIWDDVPSVHDFYAGTASREGIRKLLENVEKVTKIEDKIKGEITDYCDKKRISKYGSTNSGEFFAEAFAHLECSGAENVNEIGRETEYYLVNVMHYLPRERSKFNQ